MDKQLRIARSIERSTSDDLHADVREALPGELEAMLDDNPDLDIDAWADVMRGLTSYKAWHAVQSLKVAVRVLDWMIVVIVILTIALIAYFIADTVDILR